MEFINFIDDLIKLNNNEMTQEEFDKKYPEPDYSNKDLYPHGKCIGVSHEAYHDVYVYEDGFTEWESIGD